MDTRRNQDSDETRRQRASSLVPLFNSDSKEMKVFATAIIDDLEPIINKDLNDYLFLGMAYFFLGKCKVETNVDDALEFYQKSQTAHARTPEQGLYFSNMIQLKAAFVICYLKQNDDQKVNSCVNELLELYKKAGPITENSKELMIEVLGKVITKERFAGYDSHTQETFKELEKIIASSSPTAAKLKLIAGKALLLGDEGCSSYKEQNCHYYALSLKYMEMIKEEDRDDEYYKTLSRLYSNYSIDVKDPIPLLKSSLAAYPNIKEKSDLDHSNFANDVKSLIEKSQRDTQFDTEYYIYYQIIKTDASYAMWRNKPENMKFLTTCKEKYAEYEKTQAIEKMGNTLDNFGKELKETKRNFEILTGKEGFFKQRKAACIAPPPGVTGPACK